MKVISKIGFSNILTEGKEYEVLSRFETYKGMHYMVKCDNGSFASLLDWECIIPFKEPSHVRWRKVMKQLGFKKTVRNNGSIYYSNGVIHVAYMWKQWRGKRKLRRSNRSMRGGTKLISMRARWHDAKF